MRGRDAQEPGEEAAQVFGGQIYPGQAGAGQLCGQGQVRVDKAAAAGTLASRHTCGSRVQPKPALSRRPTNEAMDIRKKDWTGGEHGDRSPRSLLFNPLPPPSTSPAAAFLLIN